MGFGRQTTTSLNDGFDCSYEAELLVETHEVEDRRMIIVSFPDMLLLKALDEMT